MRVGCSLRETRVFLFATVLSVLFTVAFFFLMTESVGAVDGFLLNLFPDYGPWWSSGKAMETIECLRPFGYVAFGIILVLILLGFAVSKGYLSAIGSMALYLPVFGHFAFTMFFLAGIGITRALWLPLWDGSPYLIDLGDVVLLPFLPFLYAPLYVYEIGRTLSFIIIGAGVFIFFFGLLTWLYGKFKGCEIVDFWIYRVSRHPQYFGLSLWNYGMLVLTTFLPAPRGGGYPSPGLPWLVSTLTIIAVALHEEMDMVKRHGEKYLNYRGSTPFLLPLPKRLSELITIPMKVLLKKKLPENRKEIAYTISIYGVTLILLTVLVQAIFYILF